MMVMTVSERLAKWAATTGYGDMPETVVHAAKRSILDYIGVALAGSTLPVGPMVRRYLDQAGAVAQATVIGLGMKASYIEGAFANGFLGHYLDYDDYLIAVVGGGGPHLTVAVLPAALAMAEKANSRGKEIIEAYVLGCEVAYRVGRAIEPSHFNRGWHPTGTEGIFGAAAAASKLLRLSPEQTACALGIAASEASGLRENFGTATKPIHAGQAAAKGVKAVLLAGLGLDAARTAFEGKYGFCNVMSECPKVGEITEDIGRPYCLPSFVLKPYPCCGASHSAVHAMLGLVRSHQMNAGDIEGIEVRCAPTVVETLVYTQPKTALEGKFSMHFPIALAAIERRVSLTDFTDGRIREPGIVSLMRKVRLIPEEGLREQSVDSAPSIVDIMLKNGRKVSGRCDYRPGGARNPVSDGDLIEKYRGCATQALSRPDAEKSVELIMNLERVEDTGELFRVIGAGVEAV